MPDNSTSVLKTRILIAFGCVYVFWGSTYLAIRFGVQVLPPFYTTVWFGGLPYYYANDTYYAWRDSDQQIAQE